VRKIAIGIAAVIALIGTPALAADLPLQAPLMPPVPVWSWTGLYVGGNIGGAWARSSWCTGATVGNCVGGAPLDVVNQTSSNVVGGAQFGYRWELGHVVLGVEGMLDGMNPSSTSASCLSGAPPCGGVAFPNRTRSTTFNGLDSATGQLGFAWDRFLAYGKGGFASTQLGLDANNQNPGGLNLSTTKYVNGWTAGGGLEYLVLPNVSVGVEYNYYQFSVGNITNLANSGGVVIGCAFCNFGNPNVQTVTARFNVKLWDGAPYAHY
jgi:outer membrane immunogenic protein